MVLLGFTIIIYAEYIGNTSNLLYFSHKQLGPGRCTDKYSLPGEYTSEGSVSLRFYIPTHFLCQIFNIPNIKGKNF